LKTTWHLSTPRLLFYHLKTPHNSPRRSLTPTHPVTFRQILEFFCISPNHVGHYAANVACFWLGLLKIKSEARKFSKVILERFAYFWKFSIFSLYKHGSQKGTKSALSRKVKGVRGPNFGNENGILENILWKFGQKKFSGARKDIGVDIFWKLRWERPTDKLTDRPTDRRELFW